MKLFKLGFVFSYQRITSLDKIRREFPEWYAWNNITIGNDTECKMVINAALNYSIFCNIHDGWHFIKSDHPYLNTILEKIKSQ